MTVGLVSLPVALNPPPDLIGAACCAHPMEWFFADLKIAEGRSNDWPLYCAMRDRALAICAGCPVLAECFAWAMSDRESVGILGGMTTEARNRLRRSVTPRT